MFLTLAFTNIATDLVLGGVLTAMVALRLVPVKEAFSGFSNPAIISVGALFVVAAGLRETGAVSMVVEPILGRPKSLLVALIRSLVPIAALSSIMNNTPLVAMMMPVLSDWCKKRNLPVSKFLMPLSYAAILGGTITVLGTSTNLVVSGLAVDYGLPKPSLFSITPVGLPCSAIGMIYLIFAARWFIPNRTPALSAAGDPREFTVEMMVTSTGPLVGKTIEKAGLRHLPGAYLVEIDRDGETLAAVSPHETLQANDRLVFAGVVESVVDLQKIRGLAPATNQVFKLDAPRSVRSLIEAVVSENCPVVGHTIRDGRFRSIYNAVVIAVARNGSRIQKKIGDIVLQPGDTLLIEAHPSFVDQRRNTRDFYLVSSVEGSTPPRHDRIWISLAILVGMIVIAATGLVRDISVAALLAAGAMIAFRCLSAAEGRRSIEWTTLLTIASAFGIGKALEGTGAAAGLAHALLGLAGGHPWAALAAVYGVAMILTELISHNAAAALIFPIAVATAKTMGVSPMPFVIAVMMAASYGFATPIGYQTNLMVYGPGGYKFSDFVKIGAPLDLLMWACSVALIPWIFPF